MGRKKRTPATAGTKPPAAATSPEAEVEETTVDGEGTDEETEDDEGDDEDSEDDELQTTADTSVVGPKAKPRKIASERTLPKRDLGGIYKLACRMRVNGKVKKPGELVTLTDEEARSYLRAGPVIEPQD